MLVPWKKQAANNDNIPTAGNMQRRSSLPIVIALIGTLVVIAITVFSISPDTNEWLAVPDTRTPTNTDTLKR